MTHLPKTPKGAGQLILYLDFDGVLHHENVLWHPKRGPYIGAPSHFKLFQHASLLEQLLSPYPNVRIVLSTTWARTYGLHRAAKMLPPGLRDRVIGATFHSRMFIDEFLAAPRGMQVWSDVVRRKPRDWIALDDDHVDWPEWCHDNYIQTHEHEGMSEPAVLAKIKEGLAKLGWRRWGNKKPAEAGFIVTTWIFISTKKRLPERSSGVWFGLLTIRCTSRRMALQGATPH